MRAVVTGFLLSCFIFLGKTSFATTYYLSPSGDDGNAGISASQAWKTIAKLNSIVLQPGDSVLFEGNSIFPGNIFLDQSDAGTAAQPIVISTYGTGRATIEAGNSYGIKTNNTAGFQIKNLVIKGSGIATSTASGIDIYMDVAYDLSFIRIDSVEVTGFRYSGVSIGAWNTTNGFHDVQVRYLNCYLNGRAGMSTFGFNSNFNHKSFYVGNSVFHDNKGLSNVTNTNTGSGLVLSGIDNATIEYCEAYNNGENNGNPTGGPVGIWFYLVKNGVIQFSESHHNKSPSLDGGGFDIDGGSQNCIIQYCYSHDNVGPGYLMAEYGADVSFINNTIRYNISYNDARRGLGGAITFWGADGLHKVNQSYVYNNTIYIDANGAAASPAAVKLIGNNFSGVKLSNNIFYTTGDIDLIQTDVAVDSNALHFLSNNYYSASGQSSFNWAGTVFNSLSAWKAVATTQERRGSQQTGSTGDPNFAAPGSAGVASYRLQANSMMVDAGLRLNNVAGINIGARDHFNNASLTGFTQDIGAHECNDCYVVLPQSALMLNARNQKDHVLLTWKLNTPSELTECIVEYSNDGKTFSLLESVTLSASLNYSIRDASLDGRDRYYRLRLKHSNGAIFYSRIVRVTGKPVGFAVDVMRANNYYGIVINSNTRQELQFTLFNSSGQMVQRKRWMVPEGTSQLELGNALRQGIHILQVTDSAGRRQTLVCP